MNSFQDEILIVNITNYSNKSTPYMDLSNNGDNISVPPSI